MNVDGWADGDDIDWVDALLSVSQFLRSCVCEFLPIQPSGGVQSSHYHLTYTSTIHESQSGSVEALSEPFPWLEEQIGVGGVEINASKSIAWHNCCVLLQGQFDETHSLLEEDLLLSFHCANLLLFTWDAAVRQRISHMALSENHGKLPQNTQIPWFIIMFIHFPCPKNTNLEYPPCHHNAAWSILARNKPWVGRAIHLTGIRFSEDGNSTGTKTSIQRNISPCCFGDKRIASPFSFIAP